MEYSKGLSDANRSCYSTGAFCDADNKDSIDGPLTLGSGDDSHELSNIDEVVSVSDGLRGLNKSANGSKSLVGSGELSSPPMLLFEKQRMTRTLGLDEVKLNDNWNFPVWFSGGAVGGDDAMCPMCAEKAVLSGHMGVCAECLDKWVSDVAKNNDVFVCDKCGNLLVNPVKINCGHKLCSKCYNVMLCSEMKEVQCPVDSMCGIVSKIEKDTSISREITACKVTCFLQCSDPIFEFGNASEHVKICSKRYVNFNNCNEVIVKDIPSKTAKCKKQGVSDRVDIDSVLKLLGEMSEQNKKLSTRVEELEKSGHNLEQPDSLYQAAPFVKKNQHKGVIKTLQQQVCQLQQQMRVVQENNKDIPDMKSNIFSIRKYLVYSALEKKKKALVFEQYETRLSNVECLVNNLSPRVLKLGVQMLNYICYNGEVIVEITNYSEKKAQEVSGKAASWKSQVFYTSRYGYKMNVLIQLNGYNTGLGSHLSVSAGVVHSDHDDSLIWPFTPAICMCIIDPEVNENLTRKDYEVTTGKLSYDKPSSEKDIYIGVPQFALHSVVEDPKYLKNDTLYIKVSVVKK